MSSQFRGQMGDHGTMVGKEKTHIAVIPSWGIVALLIVTMSMAGCGGSSGLTTPEAGSVPVATQGDVPESGLEASVTPAAQDTSSPSEPEAVASVALAVLLRDDYPDALAARNQLALGSLRLEGTTYAITQEQAAVLKLYWQALLVLTNEPNAAAEETAAIQTQIMESMTAAQIEAIAAMALTNVDLNEYYVEQGVELTTPAPGVTPQGGKNSGLSPESREATRTAAEALGTPIASGGGGGAVRRDILLNNLIELLGQRSGE